MIITALSKGLTNYLRVPQFGYMIWIGSIAIIKYNNNKIIIIIIIVIIITIIMDRQVLWISIS